MWKGLAVLAQQNQNDIELLSQASVVDVNYPIPTPPLKVTALNFDKTPSISGVLLGIKGQYLIFDRGVLNVRKFSGYEIHFAVA